VTAGIWKDSPGESGHWTELGGKERSTPGRMRSEHLVMTAWCVSSALAWGEPSQTSARIASGLDWRITAASRSRCC
jgi:hypothetical protein